MDQRDDPNPHASPCPPANRAGLQPCFYSGSRISILLVCRRHSCLLGRRRQGNYLATCPTRPVADPSPGRVLPLSQAGSKTSFGTSRQSTTLTRCPSTTRCWSAPNSSLIVTRFLCPSTDAPLLVSTQQEISNRSHSVLEIDLNDVLSVSPPSSLARIANLLTSAPVTATAHGRGPC